MWKFFKNMRILGMGNALVDILALMKSDDLLIELNLPKGSMTLIDREKRAQIFDKIENLEKEMTTGGSASNTSLALAKMGMQVGFIGKVGSDEYGAFYIDEIKKTGVIPHFITKDASSGTAMALISPDGERTFGTYLGAAADLIHEELKADLFESYDCFYIEGYLVQNYALIEQAVKMAKSHGLKIAIDLASYNIVEANREFLQKIIVEYVDIVFANEEEARTLTGKQPEEALREMAEYVEIAVVKIGEKGSLISNRKVEVYVPAYKANFIDATAAGDYYAAGFFYGLSKAGSLEQCGKIGSLLASNIVETVGTKLTEDCWLKIKNKTLEILK